MRARDSELRFVAEIIAIAIFMTVLAVGIFWLAYWLIHFLPWPRGLK